MTVRLVGFPHCFFSFFAMVLCLGTTGGGAVAAAAGKPLPLIRDLPFEVLQRGPEKLVLPTAAEPAEQTVRLPALPVRKGRALCLRFQARLDTPKPGGWNPYLGIRINGKPLSRFTAGGGERMLKRAEFIQTTIEGKRSWWGQRGGMPVLFTVFGPADTLDERILTDREEGYWYLLDISDLVHYRRLGADGRVESETPNSITFVNTCLRRFFPKRTEGFPDLVIENLEVGYLPSDLSQRLRRLHLDEYPDVRTGPQLKGDGFTLRVAPTGGMQLLVGGDRYWFASFFSAPGKPKMIFNSLTPAGAAGVPDWKPTVKSAGDVVTLEARAGGYALHREIRLDGRRIRIRDTLRNRTDKPVGVVLRNELTLPNLPKPGTYRLAGTDRESLSNGCAANPTVFASQGGSGVGVVVEDNVYRLQLELLRHANTFRLETTHFGVAAGASYTLEWTMYPGPSPDFFDFVNRVRRDWKVNYTIDGPYVFDDKVVSGRRARIYAFGPWLDYHHDGTQSRERYRRKIAPTIAGLRRDAPDAILMPLLETNLYTFVKSKIPDGEKLPGSDRKTGRYGFVLDKKQSEILDAALGPWKDSVLRATGGRIIVDTYYEGYHKNKNDLFNLLLYLRDGNHRFQFFMDQIDFCLDTLGFDGIYIDQFSQAGSLDRKDRCSYDRWDGHTVDIGPNGRITGTRTDCNLIGATARARILERIFAKGGKVVINGQSTVRETRSLPAWRFQEMDNDNVNPLDFLHEKPSIYYWQARGLLGCPLILGVRPVRYGEAGRKHWAEAITKGVITALRNGVLYYYYTSTIPASGPGAGGYGPVNHMFPFTPVELHAGWLVGRERIITCVSRTFFWPGETKPTLVRFNLKGLPMTADFSVRKVAKGWRVEIALDDWNEIAVIE